ncbi:MAG: hypothetical protein R6V43_13535, partial [Halopseudomonas sp.]
EHEWVTCYDIASGELLWAHEDKARFAEAMGGTGPRATPTIDLENNQLFTLGATGILNCLDLATGARKWSHNLLTKFGAANLIMNCSANTGRKKAPRRLKSSSHTVVPPARLKLLSRACVLMW